MPFEFQVLSVAYEGSGEDANTVISGHIMTGELGILESVSVVLPTVSGQSFQFWVSGMQAPGPDWPIRVGHTGIVQLVLSGQAPTRTSAFPVLLDGQNHETAA